MGKIENPRIGRAGSKLSAENVNLNKQNETKKTLFRAYFTVVNRPVAVELNLAPISTEISTNSSDRREQSNHQPASSAMADGGVAHNQFLQNLSMSQPSSISVISLQHQETQTENIDCEE